MQNTLAVGLGGLDGVDDIAICASQQCKRTGRHAIHLFQHGEQRLPVGADSLRGVQSEQHRVKEVQAQVLHAKG